MNILVAAEHLGASGGMERYLEIVLPALLRDGARVHVLTPRCDAVPDGVTAEEIAWSSEHAAPSAAAGAAVARAVARFAADVAVAHNVMDEQVVRALRGAPRLAYHVHDHRPFCPNGDRVFPRRKLPCTEPLGTACAVHALTDGCAYGPRLRTLTLIRRRTVLRDAIAASDTIVAASRYVADRVAASGVPPERIAVVPLPLADDAYAEPVAPPASRSVLFAGRIVQQKGLASLVRAVGLIPAERRPRVVALGDGPALPEARREAAALGVVLDAPGAVAPAAVRAAIDDAALLVLPSLWAEPFGYVGIEALARGRPVVAYDVGGVRAWLADDANGAAVARGDEPALSRTIAALLDDGERRERLGATARRDAERYRAAPIIATLSELYRGTERSATSAAPGR